MSKEKHLTIHLRNSAGRFLIALLSIVFYLTVVLQVPESLSAVFWGLILVFFPLPLAIFGRWPPHGNPDLPFGLLSPFQRFERVWSEITVLIPFAIALIYLLKLLGY